MEATSLIVTGGSRGIGACVTKALIERGYNVIAGALEILEAQLQPSERLAQAQGDSGESSAAEKMPLPR